MGDSVQPRGRAGRWGKWGPSVWGEASPCARVGNPSPPCVRRSVQSLVCPAKSCDLGEQLVGITHGFLHRFGETARRSQEGWVTWPAQPPRGHGGKVTTPGCRRLCGAVLVTRYPGGVETPLGDTHPDLRCPQLRSASPDTTCLPQASSYLSFWIWQSFTLSTLPSSSITLSLNWLLSSLEKIQGKSDGKCLGNRRRGDHAPTASAHRGWKS